ncbi:MAG: hypothetical protein IT382_01855 [Deltaproteobacteria bacterium]|nr:hypothetical protein [Deltaproteobacteria bacterium]
MPLEDLDERIRAEWPGPRVLVLRTKRANGGAIAHTGRLALAGHPAQAPTVMGDAGMAAVMLSLQKQVADLTAALTAQHTAPAPAAPPLSDQVGALASVAQVLRTLAPGESTGRGGMTIDDVQKLLDLGKRAAGDTSLAIEALRQLGPPVGNVLQATAALLAAKVSGGKE